MFFVLSGRPTLRTGKGEEELSPGAVVYCPEGIDGLHRFSNPTDEPVRILAVSTKRFPDVVTYPEELIAWVATHRPERPFPEGGEIVASLRRILRVKSGYSRSASPAQLRKSAARGTADHRLDV
jgi:glyoxylate utilization-related uncharacterized protein